MKINLLLLGTSIFALSLILFGSSNAILDMKHRYQVPSFGSIPTKMVPMGFLADSLAASNMCCDSVF